uniref:Actin filament-associated protein 1-like 2 n=1 Tax=Pundamilia nyererei TaxID=303518 RepID=A0A3B4EYF3_9CICH
VPAPACADASESYYEEAQPYEETVNDDGEAVSSSYESYDEEEVTREKSSSAQHQWPSAEASIELMKDARICAFLWRKKWLGQWAKQLCVIKDHHLLCYKSSKEQTPLLDVSLLGCSVVYKEKQLKRKEHKLKIIPVGGETIVLGLQSKEQAEQWLKVTHGKLLLKKKYGAGLMFSNLMNIGKKKPSALESPEKCVDTSGYLNVLVNSQWRTCWCLIKNGQLWFYQDKGKNKVTQPAVSLEGCNVLPDPSPEHLYSFRIDMDGTQMATLEAKTSADMGHWLGLLLSQTGSKTDPEELTYDYVNAERISTIVNAARTSLYLMQRRYSEPNTYIDTLPSISHNSDDLYDDVASIADPEDAEENNSENRIYLDLVPVRSFLHTSSGGKLSPKEASRHSLIPPDSMPALNGTNLASATSKPEEERAQTPTPSQPQTQPVKTSTQSQETTKKTSLGITQAFNSFGGQIHKGPTSHTAAVHPHSPQPARPKAHTIVEIKLGKNRTEADMRRYIEERDRLEKEREEVKISLANLKKEKRETKEELSTCQDPKQQASLEARLKQKEEACREAEQHRVEVELQLVEVKESLKKVESGPFTLGTTLDSSLQDTPMVSVSNVNADSVSPVNSASALKGRPTSMMTTKGNVLQKAKVRFLFTQKASMSIS